MKRVRFWFWRAVRRVADYVGWLAIEVYKFAHERVVKNFPYN